MGGCFHALFIAHAYIGKGTYDPRFEFLVLDADRPWHHRRTGPVPDDPDRTGTRLRLRRSRTGFRRYSVQQTTAGAARRILGDPGLHHPSAAGRNRRVALQLENGRLHQHRDWSVVRKAYQPSPAPKSPRSRRRSPPRPWPPCPLPALSPRVPPLFQLWPPLRPPRRRLSAQSSTRAAKRPIKREHRQTSRPKKCRRTVMHRPMLASATPEATDAVTLKSA